VVLCAGKTSLSCSGYGIWLIAREDEAVDPIMNCFLDNCHDIVIYPIHIRNVCRRVSVLRRLYRLNVTNVLAFLLLRCKRHLNSRCYDSSALGDSSAIWRPCLFVLYRLAAFSFLPTLCNVPVVDSCKCDFQCLLCVSSVTQSESSL
jgi:hypothetical protein